MNNPQLNKQDLNIIRQGIRAHVNGLRLCDQLNSMIETNPRPLLRGIKQHPGNEKLALAGLNAYLSVAGAPVNYSTIQQAIYLGASRGPQAAESYAKAVKKDYRCCSFARY